MKKLHLPVCSGPLRPLTTWFTRHHGNEKRTHRTAGSTQESGSWKSDGGQMGPQGQVKARSTWRRKEMLRWPGGKKKRFVRRVSAKKQNLLFDTHNDNKGKEKGPFLTFVDRKKPQRIKICYSKNRLLLDKATVLTFSILSKDEGSQLGLKNSPDFFFNLLTS